jgi:hypothetical protein
MVDTTGLGGGTGALAVDIDPSLRLRHDRSPRPT